MIFMHDKVYDNLNGVGNTSHSTSVTLQADLPRMPEAENPIKDKEIKTNNTKVFVAPKVVAKATQKDSLALEKSTSNKTEKTTSISTGISGVYEAGGVQIPPSFPGGEEEMKRYLSRNIHYPEAAIRKKKEGNVVLSFIVLESGRLTNILISKSLSPEIDAEALRIVNAMPPWDPGIQNGKEVKVSAKLVIEFKLPR